MGSFYFSIWSVGRFLSNGRQQYVLCVWCIPVTKGTLTHDRSDQNGGTQWLQLHVIFFRLTELSIEVIVNNERFEIYS